MSIFEKYFKEKYNPLRPSTFIIKVKANTNGELDDLKRLTSFLDEYYKNPPVTQRIKHYAAGVFFVHKCPICDNPLLYREKPNPDYHKTCGKIECRHKFNYLSTAESMKEKYGVENISQTKEWNEKVKSTNLRKRGVEWNTQRIELIDARRASWKENKEDQIAARIATNQKKYGSDYAIQNKEVKEKFKKSINNSEDLSDITSLRIQTSKKNNEQ